MASGGAGRSAEDLHDLSGLFFRAGLGLGLGRGRARRVLNSALAGAPRSHAHDADVALEAVKVIALLVGGILLLTGAGRTWSG